MLLFTYGSLLRNLHNYFRFFDKLKFVREETIAGDYVLTTYPNLCYPFLSTVEHFKKGFPTFNQTCNTVKGEVFEISEETMKRIDSMEIGAGYKREALHHTQCHSNSDQEPIYLYLYTRSFYTNAIIVPNNDWMPYVQQNEKRYWEGCVREAKEFTPTYYNFRDAKGRFMRKPSPAKTILLKQNLLTLPESEMQKVLKRNAIWYSHPSYIVTASQPQIIDHGDSGHEPSKNQQTGRGGM